MIAKLFKASVMMIPDVSVGLAQLLSNLGEGIALKKV
jgi:hypothetical protein